MLEGKKCKVDNCENKYFEKGYCGRHYLQFRTYGKILKRTRYDPNEIIDCGDYYEICLYQGSGEQIEVARALIDKEDLEKIKGYKWGIRAKKGKKYIITTINKKKYFLHHLIFGNPPKGYEVDHSFGNTLDNRKSNLRFVTHQQNSMNKKCKGYCWNKQYKRWETYIQINSIKVNLGYFKEEQDAINARKEAEQKYYGKFAYKEK
jgi:hypothetical protein